MGRMVDTMVLGSGHSMMVGNLTNKIALPSFSEKFYQASRVEVNKFGLFGSNTDYNTYYPDVTPEDVKPKDSEFIEPVFRMLSNCIVAKNYMPTEFPKDILKASMGLLLGQTVNCDHETEIGNAIGSVKEVSWQNAYTDETMGIEIPAGINAVLKIDAKANPRIARGIMMDPPSIHSNSVTVQFEWKPSHSFEKEWEFYDKIGTIAEDGTMVRRIVTNIISYKETSLVSHGADPFAQIIKNGKINNPQYAGATYYSFSDMPPMDEKTLRSKIAYLDFKDIRSNDIMYNTSKPNYEGNQNPKIQNDMNELQKFLDQLFSDGVLSLAEGSTPSMEVALSQVKDLVVAKNSLTQEKAKADQKISELQGEVTSLKEQISANQAMVNIGTSHLSEVRSSAIASYKKLYGDDKVDQNILALLEADSTNIETLLSLKATYDAQLDEKFPMRCAKCGSHDVSRASSSIQGNDPEDGTMKNSENNSVFDTVSSIAYKKNK
jgi:hypothetical protein|nr:MAG TPA_asm: hypothetical protein [Caudoviricetes sp.]